jgi:hypothetical protein
MPITFCNRVTRKLARLGYHRKAARRLATACAILMAVTCGLMGIDVNEKEPLRQIAGAGVIFSGAPAGNVSPASSVIRR